MYNRKLKLKLLNLFSLFLIILITSVFRQKFQVIQIYAMESFGKNYNNDESSMLNDEKYIDDKNKIEMYNITNNEEVKSDCLSEGVNCGYYFDNLKKQAFLKGGLPEKLKSKNFENVNWKELLRNIVVERFKDSEDDEILVFYLKLDSSYEYLNTLTKYGTFVIDRNAKPEDTEYVLSLEEQREMDGLKMQAYRKRYKKDLYKSDLDRIKFYFVYNYDEKNIKLGKLFIKRICFCDGEGVFNEFDVKTKTFKNDFEADLMNDRIQNNSFNENNFVCTFKFKEKREGQQRINITKKDLKTKLDSLKLEAVCVKQSFDNKLVVFSVSGSTSFENLCAAPYFVYEVVKNDDLVAFIECEDANFNKEIVRVGKIMFTKAALDELKIKVHNLINCTEFGISVYDNRICVKQSINDEKLNFFLDRNFDKPVIVYDIKSKMFENCYKTDEGNELYKLGEFQYSKNLLRCKKMQAHLLAFSTVPNENELKNICVKSRRGNENLMFFYLNKYSEKPFNVYDCHDDEYKLKKNKNNCCLKSHYSEDELNNLKKLAYKKRYSKILSDYELGNVTLIFVMKNKDMYRPYDSCKAYEKDECVKKWFLAQIKFFYKNAKEPFNTYFIRTKIFKNDVDADKLSFDLCNEKLKDDEVVIKFNDKSFTKGNINQIIGQIKEKILENNLGEEIYKRKLGELTDLTKTPVYVKQSVDGNLNFFVDKSSENIFSVYNIGKDSFEKIHDIFDNVYGDFIVLGNHLFTKKELELEKLDVLCKFKDYVQKSDLGSVKGSSDANYDLDSSSNEFCSEKNYDLDSITVEPYYDNCNLMFMLTKEKFKPCYFTGKHSNWKFHMKI